MSDQSGYTSMDEQAQAAHDAEKDAVIAAQAAVIEAAATILTKPYPGQEWSSDLNRNQDWALSACDTCAALSSAPSVSLDAVKAEAVATALAPTAEKILAVNEAFEAEVAWLEAQDWAGRTEAEIAAAAADRMTRAALAALQAEAIRSGVTP